MKLVAAVRVYRMNNLNVSMLKIEACLKENEYMLFVMDGLSDLRKQGLRTFHRSVSFKFFSVFFVFIFSPEI